jgi:hypothetical protein
MVAEGEAVRIDGKANSVDHEGVEREGLLRVVEIVAKLGDANVLITEQIGGQRSASLELLLDFFYRVNGNIRSLKQGEEINPATQADRLIEQASDVLGSNSKLVRLLRSANEQSDDLLGERARQQVVGDLRDGVDTDTSTKSGLGKLESARNMLQTVFETGGNDVGYEVADAFAAMRYFVGRQRSYEWEVKDQAILDTVWDTLNNFIREKFEADGGWLMQWSDGWGEVKAMLSRMMTQ